MKSMTSIRSLIRELSNYFKIYGDLPVRGIVDGNVADITKVLVQHSQDGTGPKNICLICDDSVDEAEDSET